MAISCFCVANRTFLKSSLFWEFQLVKFHLFLGVQRVKSISIALYFFSFISFKSYTLIIVSFILRSCIFCNATIVRGLHFVSLKLAFCLYFCLTFSNTSGINHIGSYVR